MEPLMQSLGAKAAKSHDEIWAQVIGAIRFNPFQIVVITDGVFQTREERERFLSLATPDLQIMVHSSTLGVGVMLRRVGLPQSVWERYWPYHRRNWCVGGESYVTREGRISSMPFTEIEYVIKP